LRTLHNLVALDAGLDTAHILSFSADPGESGYDTVRTKELVKTLVARLQATPGVVAAGVASQALLEGGSWNSFMTIEGHPAEPGRNRLTLNNRITPGYFRAMGMQIVAGRDFDARNEQTTAPSAKPEPPRVAIANERFVKQYLGGDPALG